jgi:8-oxo-dGTP diphosphatase
MHLIRTLISRPFQMPKQREIVKIGLAVTDENRLLLVRKRGGESFILPGGKPELGEDDRQALVREIEEELGCGIDVSSIDFLGSFSDVAADLQNTIVTVRLYSARLTGLPSPQSEIEQLRWFKPDCETDLTLAPSLQNQIVPFLCSNGHL